MKSTLNGRLFLLLLSIIVLPLVTSCNEQPFSAAEQKELLIYCGVTMGQPIQLIATRFEKQHNCRIIIIQGGSGDLHRSIHSNKAGDLYLPGSQSYQKKCLTEQLTEDSVTVGTNRAALIVAKGNPHNLSADLNNFLQENLRIVLGDADSSSIGQESKQILLRAGIYEQAQNQAIYLTNDSSKLSEAIRTDKADLTLSWLATTYWENNRDQIEAIPLADDIAPTHDLVLSILKYSRDPELAKEFLTYAAGPEGQAIFAKYGLHQGQE